MRSLVLIGGALLWVGCTSAFAQDGQAINLRLFDPNTNASTYVGDSANKAMRVNIVAGSATCITATDNGTIATSLVPCVNASETNVYDGANWKRFTIGTAGTPSTQVLTVQGISSGTRLPVTGQDSGGTSTTDTTAHANKSLAVDSTGTAVPLSDGGAGATSSNTVRTIRASDQSLVPGTLKSGAVTTAMTATTSTAVIAAQASNYLYVTSCSFSNDHASTSTLMKLQDGSGGTVLWEGMVPFGGGNNVTFSPAPLKVPTIGNGLYVVNVTTSSSTYASCSGFYTTVSF